MSYPLEIGGTSRPVLSQPGTRLSSAIFCMSRSVPKNYQYFEGVRINIYRPYVCHMIQVYD